VLLKMNDTSQPKPSNKKVIFIAGSDFSGTTMLDLTLGSTRNTSSLGELYPLILPTSKSHLLFECSCKQQCDNWPSELRQRGAHEALFQKRGLDVLIDSSKDPSWIDKNVRALKERGISSQVVLVWKDPAAYAVSCIKRGRRNWAKKWIDYHNAIFQIDCEIYTISLTHLVQTETDELGKLCKYLNLKFDTSMRDYWRIDHHIAFGSATARVKLHPPNSSEYSKTAAESFKDYTRNRVMEDQLSKLQPKTRKEIESILNIVTTNGPKTSPHKAIKHHLYKQSLKKRLERLVFLLGIDPRFISKLFNNINRSAR